MSRCRVSAGAVTSRVPAGWSKLPMIATRAHTESVPNMRSRPLYRRVHGAALAFVLGLGCGGEAAHGVDASPSGDGGSLDAQPGLAYVQLVDEQVTLSFVEAYLYIYEATIQLRLNASTEADFDCFGSRGCTSLYVTLPEDVVLGDAACGPGAVSLIVQRDDAYYSADAVPKAPGSCALAVDQRGPVGAWTAISGITGVLTNVDGGELVIEDGAIGAVRSDDITPK